MTDTQTLSRSTPFSRFYVEGDEVDSTEFAAVVAVWPALTRHHRSLFHGSSWRYEPTEWDLPLATTLLRNWFGQIQTHLEGSAGLLVNVTSSEALTWRISLSVTEPVEVAIGDDAHDTAGEDRRVYALASVQKLQRLLHLTQDEVADLVGVSRPTLWNWMHGRVPQVRSL